MQAMRTVGVGALLCSSVSYNEAVYRSQNYINETSGGKSSKRRKSSRWREKGRAKRKCCAGRCSLLIQGNSFTYISSRCEPCGLR